MKIVHVTQSLRENSGVSVFVAGMANAMADFGHEVTVVYTESGGLRLDSGVKTLHLASLNRLKFVPDVVHIHGVWAVDMVRAMRWCKKNKVKYFVSPHGGLMPRVLRKGWLKKHLFYWALLRAGLKHSDGIHCTGDGEIDAVVGLHCNSRAFIVPLGCDLPDVNPLDRRMKIVLFLSRISEEKGLLHLVDAWRTIPHNGWRLVLAGPDWRGYRRVVEAKIARESVTDIEFCGSADERQKDRLYRQAGLFVLPSPTENFSMAVLDALAYALPVVCTRGCPWQVIEQKNCGWWVLPNSAESLANALTEGISLSDHERTRKGYGAREIATDFRWDKLAQRLLREYGNHMNRE